MSQRSHCFVIFVMLWIANHVRDLSASEATLCVFTIVALISPAYFLVYRSNDVTIDSQPPPGYQDAYLVL